MNFRLRMTVLGACLVAVPLVLIPEIHAQTPEPSPISQGSRPQRRPTTVGSQGPLPQHAKFSATQIGTGSTLFLQNCAFCHGKDAGGGEAGPDLTRSKMVSSDQNGEGIAPVIRNGRTDKGMPKFNLPDSDIVDLVAFIHSQQDKALSQSGNRKGVDPSDLQTGNVEAGQRYFEGAGGCTKCHSATSLAGVATRLNGLRLEMQMLYPRDVKSKITVKTKSGQKLTGTLQYHDEFTIGMTDSSGTYHSWPTTAVTFQIDDPLQAHAAALSKYTDDDIHNLIAYIQTLK